MWILRTETDVMPPLNNDLLGLITGPRRMQAYRDPKRQWETYVCSLAREAGLQDLPPCTVEITQHLTPQMSRDIDSVSLISKAILDGLVAAGVWPDDNPRWVRALTLTDHVRTLDDVHLEIRLVPVA